MMDCPGAGGATASLLPARLCQVWTATRPCWHILEHGGWLMHKMPLNSSLPRIVGGACQLSSKCSTGCSLL